MLEERKLIQTLPDHLINQIAAGEVVERPFSVVKECVENSLDAGATKIEVQIQEGGKKSILIRDNGCGIPADQLKLALSRHSTSKISSQEDLSLIDTLGFRGEALASIASVSKLSLTSRIHDKAVSAYEVFVEGGKMGEPAEVGHPFGTTLSIKYLFYQTPARLKFLKSTETEMSHISDCMTRLALSHPEVAFSLQHQGKQIFKVPENQDIRSRIQSLFDQHMGSATYPVHSSQSDIQILGEIAHPQVNFSQNKYVYLFVNGRSVRDKVLYHAVFEGYRSQLMRGRYPFVVLFLQVPPSMVDVNVHPAKTEVRFSQSQIVHRAVYEAVGKTLRESPWYGNKQENDNDKRLDISEVPTNQSSYRPSREAQSNLWEAPGKVSTLKENFTQPTVDTGNRIIGESQQFWNEQSDRKEVRYNRLSYSSLEIIGQLLGTYLVCQSNDKLVLIDQHAAHERIGFEKLKKAYDEGGIPSQQLLIPENFDLNPSEVDILKNYLQELEKFGFEIEHFGGNTFVTKAKPVLFANKVPMKSFIMDLINDVLNQGHMSTLQDKLEHTLASMACHHAIRAHHLLNKDQMSGLLSELERYQFTSFCPHGRPVAIEVTKYEIEKWFKRIVS